MKEPSTLHYISFVTASILFAAGGIALMANFSRLFQRSIRNELLRKNTAVWLIIFCLNAAIMPLGGGFYVMLQKFGWVGIIIGQLASTTLCTIVIYNLVRMVADSPQLRKLSFIKHNLLILLTLIITTLAINIPTSYVIYQQEATRYLKYVIAQSIYLTCIIGFVYSLLSYLDIERKRKLQEKELELSRLRELKSKAELDALHSKVNPHFLYNSLNSIADLSITDGRKARKMTIALADLFRYSINYSNNNFSPVKDEVEMSEVYLQIEKIRFEDQLNYTIETDRELDHFLVPRFVMQPLVENAVKHGLKATGKMTEIVLQVKKEGEELVINVIDSGPPFPNEMNPGYGVKSVYDKMDLLFPGQYEIHFSNAPRKQVSVRINKLMKNEPGV